ncbi:MAG: hypothetical protein IIC24_09535 [Chloroflexi bacterium]|nr:hypothetical protein [Chloroflexota bacterium]MCH8310226.1 hypothetical protein [Chloroflexota bacterium]
MFRKALTSIKPARMSGFNAYMSNLNRMHGAGGPTADEARKDYRAAARSESAWAGL